MGNSPNTENVIAQGINPQGRDRLAEVSSELRDAMSHMMWLRESEKLSSCVMCGGAAMWNSEDGLTCSQPCHRDLVQEARRGKIYLIKIEEQLETVAKRFNMQISKERAGRTDDLWENIDNLFDAVLRIPYAQICQKLKDCNELFRAMYTNPTMPSSSSDYLRTLVQENEALISQLHAMHNSQNKILGTIK